MTVLRGGHNFRDIGGYAAAGGERVRRGVVFRSGMLTSLDQHDLALLRDAGLALIFDLRSAAERTKYPTPWREAGAVAYQFDDTSAPTGDLYRLIESGAANAGEMWQAMLGVYRDLVFDHASAFANILRAIAGGQLPLVFHCAAGKDRTGVLTALLLSFLGVDHRTVQDDYRLTNEAIDLLDLLKRQRAAKGDHASGLDAIPIEALIPLLRAEPEYLDAAFAEIIAKCGTLAAYFNDVLQLSGAEQDALRTRLLEKDVEDSMSTARKN